MTTTTENELLQFPCEYTLKVFGINGAAFETAALSIVRAHIPTLNDQTLVINRSSNGKYASLSLTFTADSREQLDNLYRALSSSSDILMAL